MKNIVICSCGLLLTSASLQATTLFSDTFDSYTDGNLAGQAPWAQNGSTATFPIQVNSGKVVLGPTGQDLNAALSSPFSLVDGTSFYIGATINLSAAQTTGDYFLHWSPATSSTVFISRLFAKSAGSGFQLGYVETSGTGASLTYGTETLNFNQDYRVVIAYNVVGGGTANDTASVYVNPTDSALEGNNTAYLTDTWNSSLNETTTLGAINLRQGSTTAAPSLTIDNLAVGTAFSDVASVPEPSTFALLSLGVAGFLAHRRRKA